jgi:hypothetical protein
MTVGIGVLATTEEARKEKRTPDTAILLADTMGSYEDVDSHSRLHKALMFPDDRLYAVASGDVAKAAQLLPCICTFLREIPRGEKTFGKIQVAIVEGCFHYKHHIFTLSELPRLRLPPHAFNPNQRLEPELNERMQAEWMSFDIGCDLVIAAFDDEGRAYLFESNAQQHAVHHRSFPGFAAIGTGGDNALFWLTRRQHTLGLLPLRAAYHAYEAKLTAEGSAHVNEHLDLIVATSTDHWFCTTHKSVHGEKEHPAINIPNLKRLLKRYWIKSTDQIGARRGNKRKSRAHDG